MLVRSLKVHKSQGWARCSMGLQVSQLGLGLAPCLSLRAFPSLCLSVAIWPSEGFPVFNMWFPKWEKCEGGRGVALCTP